MTFRSIVVGLLVAVAISSFCWFHDNVIGQGMLVPNLMPPIIYGGLILLVLLANPLLNRISPRLMLSGRELAVIAGVGLVACGISSWGLAQSLPAAAIMPRHYIRTKPEWRGADITRMIPAPMAVDTTAEGDAVLNGYVRGIGDGDKHIPFSKVPWRAWTGTLAFWLPLALAITVALLGLAVVMHRQWAHHERLPYPITIFAHSLLPGQGQMWGPVFYRRSFWFAAAIVFVIQMNNYAYGWWPGYLIKMPLNLDFRSLKTIMPWMYGHMLAPTIVFSIIGLAYFLPTNVSLSVCAAPFMYFFIMAVMKKYGMTLGGGHHLGIGYVPFMFGGGYFGVFFLLLYMGRHYYWNVLKRSLFLRAKIHLEGEAVWGMRAFLVGCLCFIVLLSLVGLDWQLGALYTAFAVMTFVVISRVVAETGAFHFGTYFVPWPIVVGLLGTTAVGPGAVMIMALVSCAFMLAPGWAPMPFVVQALKLGDMAGVKVSRVAQLGIVTVLLCLAIAVGLGIYGGYDLGAPEDWPHYATQYPARDTALVKLGLEAKGTLGLAESVKGWHRFRHISPDPTLISVFVLMASLALLIGFMHIRFSWWPFHPVMCVFLLGGGGQWMALSLFLGWSVKAITTKYGGATTYNRLKPLMIGLIAGDVVSRLVPMLIGTLYYVATGDKPILQTPAT